MVLMEGLNKRLKAVNKTPEIGYQNIPPQISNGKFPKSLHYKDEDAELELAHNIGHAVGRYLSYP